MLSRILQHVKDPVFLQMYKLLEEKYLPPSLSDGFKQVSDITSLNEINKIYDVKPHHSYVNSYADLHEE